MARERFKRQGKGTFFGEMIYERIVPKDHFLRKLDELIPWERFTQRLVKLYEGKGKRGRPPYDPAVLLKMLLVAYLYDLSERQVEAVANDSLSVKYFLGLAADEPAPDHSTLTAFKRRLIDNGGGAVFEQLLVEIVGIAHERGIEFGAIQVMDSVHTEADVNTSKDDQRQNRGQGPRDGGARWGVKHKRRVKDEQGHTRKVPKYFYGYKAHVSLNAETEMITSVMVTAGNAYDGHELPHLLKKDLAAGIPIEIVAADRGYDDGENHYLLELEGLSSAICLNAYRTNERQEQADLDRPEGES